MCVCVFYCVHNEDPPFQWVNFQVSQVCLSLFSMSTDSFSHFYSLLLSLFMTHIHTCTCTHARSCKHTKVKILEQPYLWRARRLKTPPHAEWICMHFFAEWKSCSRSVKSHDVFLHNLPLQTSCSIQTSAQQLWFQVTNDDMKLQALARKTCHQNWLIYHAVQ